MRAGQGWWAGCVAVAGRRGRSVGSAAAGKAREGAGGQLAGNALTP